MDELYELFEKIKSGKYTLQDVNDFAEGAAQLEVENLDEKTAFELLETLLKAHYKRSPHEAFFLFNRPR